MASRTDLVAAATATPEVANGNGAPKTIFDMLQDPRHQQQLVMAMNDEAGARRLTRIIMTEIRKTPKIGECTPQSLLGAAMMCAQLNLEPGELGQAYIIPRWSRKAGANEANFQLGYKGMIELAYRTGKVRSIHADAVCQGDTFHLRVGTGGGFVHEVDYTRPRGEVYAFYAYAELADGGWTAKVLPLDEINEKHRARSDAYNWAETGDSKKGGGKKDSPWHTNYHEMSLKTVLRVLFTWLPKSVDIIDAMEADNGVVMADLAHHHDKGLTVTHEDLMLGEVPPVLSEAPVTVHTPANEDGEPWDRPAPGAIETTTTATTATPAEPAEHDPEAMAKFIRSQLEPKGKTEAAVVKWARANGYSDSVSDFASLIESPDASNAAADWLEGL